MPAAFGARPVLRRMVVERDVPRRTAVQQLSNIYWRILDEAGDVRSALNSAFDVEPVTRRFIEEYDRVFDFAARAVREARGGLERESDAEDRSMFVQTLFNRLTFVYFLKGVALSPASQPFLRDSRKVWRQALDRRGQARGRRGRLALVGGKRARSRLATSQTCPSEGGGAEHDRRDANDDGERAR